MGRRSTYYCWVAAVFCIVVGLYDIFYVIAQNLPDRRIALALRPVVDGPAVYPDFITPYAAVHAYFENKQSLIYDHARFSAFCSEFYAHRLDFNLRLFLYPPVWLLLLLPFGLLPVYAACTVFMVATAAASAFASGRHLWSWVAVASSPAAVWTVLSGQNAFFYVALMYGGMRLLERSPVVAGIVLGILVYKPQICLLVPLALLAARQWKALASMITTGVSLVAVSLLVFGVDFWIDYLAMTRKLSEPPLFDLWTRDLAYFSISPFVAAYTLQLPNGIATALQLGAAGLAAGAVWFAFRRHPSSAVRTAVLAAGTLLTSPYALFYDLLLLMPAALTLYRQGATKGFYPGELLLYPVLWLMPTALFWFNTRFPIIPLVVLALGFVAVVRLRGAPGREASISCSG